MADESITVTKKKGLPPLSPKESGDMDSENKPVKRKVKKKVPRSAESQLNEDGTADEVKPAPRRRRKRSPSQTKDSGPETAAVPDSVEGAPTSTTPKKKKKKPKAATDKEIEQSADGRADTPTTPTTPKQETQGSKTSLITKEGDTPRTKVVKKKKKKVKKAAATQEDEFGESPWAEDLRAMQEDIVTSDTMDKEEEDEVGDTQKTTIKTPREMATTSILVPSRPRDKIFVETSSKFKGFDRGMLTKQLEEEGVKAAATNATPVVSQQTTIDFALASHRFFRILTLFLHGMTAGLCLWQIVIIFKLTSFSKQDFLEHYYGLSMPFHCSLYFLLVLCTVSTCDRFDIGNPTPRFILHSLTLQNGAVSILFYLVTLVLHLIALRYEDKIYLYKEQETVTTLGTTANPVDFIDDGDVDMFRSMNTARCVFAILSWVVLSITPRADRLGKNLLSGETGLGEGMKTDRMSLA